MCCPLVAELQHCCYCGLGCNTTTGLWEAALRRDPKPRIKFLQSGRSENEGEAPQVLRPHHSRVGGNDQSKDVTPQAENLPGHEASPPGPDWLAEKPCSCSEVYREETKMSRLSSQRQPFSLHEGFSFNCIRQLFISVCLEK